MPEGDSSIRVAFLPPAEFRVERVFPIRKLVATAVESLADETSTSIQPVAGENSVGEIATRVLVDPAQLDVRPDVNIEPTPTVSNDQQKLTSLAPVHSYSTISLGDTIQRIKPTRSPSATVSATVQDHQELLKGRWTTERIHLISAESGPPGIRPGLVSSNSERVFHRCEDEPIHIPGAIQSFGVLVALRYDGEKNLKVRITSENSVELLEYTPEGLFSLQSFLDIFNDVSKRDIAGRIDDALTKASHPKHPRDAHLDVASVEIHTPVGLQKQLWCAIHISNGTEDLIICEFEEYSTRFYLGDRYLEEALPDYPAHTLDLEIDPEEWLKSTTRESEPLRVLNIARRRNDSDASSMDIFGAMTDAQSQLGNASCVQQVMDIVVGIISELTGFHRVMCYRFDAQKNGCIEAEYVNPRASKDLFRGMHYPASDIPQQARELYKLNRIRVLYDRDAETALLVCRETEDFIVPLDLSHAYLRAMSPIHLKYLKNMGVRSSMSISIVINGNLWGLIACHSYGDAAIRVTLPVRELCRNIGECAATNIERLFMIERIKARQNPRSTPPPQNPSSFIAASSVDLLRVFGADFGLLSIQDEARTIGKLEPYREALAILAHLQSRRFTSIFSSQNVNKTFPNIKYPPGIHTIAGLLIMPLSVNSNDFLVFFRKGQLQEIRWAGNPYEKLLKPGTDYLEPRMSFQRWTEKVVGLSTEWTEDQLETASVLSLLYGRFIEIWRQKESAGQTNRMTRLLLRNSSHEVRTPLNAIINYLELALENNLDNNTRELLSKAHNASRSLIYVIDDLLNLTKAEGVPLAASGETFDLGATVSEVITSFRKEAIRKGLDLTVSTHQGIPEMVKGDASRLRQVLSNVTSNAFQHSVDGGIKVDIKPLITKDNISVICITVQDAGLGMSEDQLDDLFREFEEVFDDQSQFFSSDTTSSTARSDETGSLGVGLAVVARYVRNMNGTIRVQSELGKGTIFGIELPFEHISTTPPLSLPPSSPYSMPALRALSDTSNTPVATPLTPGEKKSNKPSVLPIPESEDASRMISLEARTGISLSSRSSTAGYPFPQMNTTANDSQGESLNVLMAEDNPINSRLLSRRLQKLGHSVEITVDGQECGDHFKTDPEGVDVILMDIQMPLVDGIHSARMIRAYEKSDDGMRRTKQRVPIIAVSASLTEENRFDYVDAGFDGWILKPIDFSRLDFMLRGINTPDLKRQALYLPGHWERGGWFLL